MLGADRYPDGVPTQRLDGDHTVQFRADPTCVRTCRQWAAQVSAEHGATPAALQVVALLTSELFTNAVKYGPPGGLIDVAVERTEHTLRVSVSDDGNELPVVVLDPPPSAPGGRGMRLVQMLAHAWGVDTLPGRGKTVWFEVPVATGTGTTAPA